MHGRPVAGLLLVVLLAACGGGSDDPRSPAATVATPTTERSTTTTEAPTPEQEVEAAYLESWAVYAEAVRELDDSRLAEVYAGDALALRREEIGDYKAAKTPGVIDVEHDYVIQMFDENRRALVVDRYVNHSVFVDPDSGEPTEPDPNERLARQYELRVVEGTWKVVYVTLLD